MGELASGSNETSLKTNNMPRLAKIAGVIMILLGALAPITISWYSSFGSYDITIQSLFWMLYLGSFGPFFQIIPFYVIFSSFPILILRLVPASMIFRYYQGKTTRRRALIGIMVGDIFFLAEGFLFLVISFSMFMGSYFVIPFPLQMLVGFFILWKFPIREPTKPWESSKETKPWWEKESSEIPASSDSNDDKNTLW
jgi:hypothetical protein